MHPSVANILLGQHSGAVLSYGLNLDKFCELNTPKRHALAAGLSTARSKRDKVALGHVCDLISELGDGVSLGAMVHSGLSSIPEGVFKRIEDPHLWSPKEYRALLKIAKSESARRVLQHKRSIRQSDISILVELPEQWHKSKIIELIDSARKYRALLYLGEAIRFVCGVEREKAFISAVDRAGKLDGIEERFWRFLFRDQSTPKQPINKTSCFTRITTERQCRMLAKAGHCFGDIEMIDAVLASESFFYSWSGAKDAVIELARDGGNFGWYVQSACRPKAKALTKLQRKALAEALPQLKTRISLFKRIDKVHSALKALEF